MYFPAHVWLENFLYLNFFFNKQHFLFRISPVFLQELNCLTLHPKIMFLFTSDRQQAFPLSLFFIALLVWGHLSRQSAKTLLSYRVRNSQAFLRVLMPVFLFRGNVNTKSPSNRVTFINTWPNSFLEAISVLLQKCPISFALISLADSCQTNPFDSRHPDLIFIW